MRVFGPIVEPAPHLTIVTAEPKSSSNVEFNTLSQIGVMRNDCEATAKMLIRSPINIERASQSKDQLDLEINAYIARVATRDRLAFNNLFQATSGYLLRRLTRLLGSKQEAEDALQEVYVRVWLRAAQFNPARGDGKHWLSAVARNYAIDVLRRRRNRDVAIELLEYLCDGSIGIEQRLIARSNAHQIYACFQTLDPFHAAALQRAYLYGESYANLSLRYNVPLNTMRTWMRRSLQKVRVCMEFKADQFAVITYSTKKTDKPTAKVSSQLKQLTIVCRSNPTIKLPRRLSRLPISVPDLSLVC